MSERDELFHQDEELSGVLQQVSSQLRLSLGNIYYALQRLAPPEKRDADEKLDLNAAVLAQSYYRILRLTNNLSDASEPERPPEAGLANGDIVGLCRDIMDRAEGPARLLGIQLDFQSAKSSHIIAMDSSRIERMMLNLLSNAFKFIREDEKRVTLEVKVEREFVLLALTDTGRGIAPELLDSVFDRCRETNRLDPPPHGLGLGLPICRRIAREHEGGLVLTSHLGQGTTVTVSLPNRRVAQMLHTPLPAGLVDSGLNKTVLELSDALPKQAFTQRYHD